jgi:gamma-glutamylcyclotransferase (GGCT)/AIG2-like uncharacterized protein YtfP
MADSERITIFVYGTLRRGGSNHHRMARAQWMAPAALCGRMYRIDWYPGVILDPLAGKILGELYSVDDELLASLDFFEGLIEDTLLGSEYSRVLTSVTLQKGETVMAWVWEWLGGSDETKRVWSGDWLSLDSPLDA